MERVAATSAPTTVQTPGSEAAVERKSSHLFLHQRTCAGGTAVARQREQQMPATYINILGKMM